MRFEWDADKAAANLKKHRVSFDEAVTVFYDPLTATFGNPNLDYSKAVRGKYYRWLLKEGATVVVLDPDVAKTFRSSAAVNEALRSLLRMSEGTRRLISRSSGRAASAPLSVRTEDRWAARTILLTTLAHIRRIPRENATGEQNPAYAL